MTFNCFHHFKSTTGLYGLVEHSEKFGDLEWINQQIDLLPIRMQKEVKARYSEIYTELCESDPLNSRFRANTWLRKNVDKFKAQTNSDLPF